MFLGWFSSIYLKKESLYQNSIERVRDFKVPNMSVECKSFDEVIPSYPNDFLYCDPPYYMEKKEGDDDNKMFKAIYPNSNWAIHHIHFDHDKLRDLLHSHNGKFILSYNDCEWVRENYKGFKFKTPEWAYSYGQGETRIGKNKQNNDPKKSHRNTILIPHLLNVVKIIIIKIWHLNGMKILGINGVDENHDAGICRKSKKIF